MAEQRLRETEQRLKETEQRLRETTEQRLREIEQILKPKVPVEGTSPTIFTNKPYFIQTLF